MSDIRSTEGTTTLHERRWLGPALLVSLIINLFLLGMIATALIFGPRPPHGEQFGEVPPPFLRALHKDVSELPSDDRAALRTLMIQQFPAIQPYIVKMETARKELAVAIGKTPYNAADVSAAFQKVDDAQTEMIHATRGAMIEGFGKLNPEQRQRLSQAMYRQAERRMTKSNAGRPDAPPPGPLGIEIPSFDGPPHDGPPLPEGLQPKP